MSTKVNALTALLLAVGAVLITVAVSYDTTTSRNPHGFYVSGGSCLAAAAVLVLWYYLLHPWLLAMDARRTRLIDAHATDAHGTTKPVRVRRTKLKIHAASYGALDGWKNVTQIVRDSIDGDRLVLPVTNETMGHDPKPDVEKHLDVDYSFNNGDRRSASFDEGTTAVLPEVR